ncbi:MAG: hypothetical protein WBE78_03855 [Candidatus Binataceae bacterium]
MIHARVPLRTDPDYIDRRGKRVSMILGANLVESAITEFSPHIAERNSAISAKVNWLITPTCTKPGIKDLRG